MFFFFFQAEDGIRDLVRSRGLGDVYKRQEWNILGRMTVEGESPVHEGYIWGNMSKAEPEKFMSLIHI